MKKKEESEKRERKKEVVCAAVATIARQISTLFFGSAKVRNIKHQTSKSCVWTRCSTQEYVAHNYILHKVLKYESTIGKRLPACGQCLIVEASSSHFIKNGKPRLRHYRGETSRTTDHREAPCQRYPLTQLFRILRSITSFFDVVGLHYINQDECRDGPRARHCFFQYHT